MLHEEGQELLPRELTQLLLPGEEKSPHFSTPDRVSWPGQIWVGQLFHIS